MSNSVSHLFSVVNPLLVGPVRVETPNPSGGVTITEEIKPILGEDGKRQYSKNNNIRLTCDNDPDFVFPSVIKLSILKTLVKGTQVQLTEVNYVKHNRDGRVAEVSRPKDENGKLRGYSSMVYMPEYVRPAGKACPALSKG